MEEALKRLNGSHPQMMELDPLLPTSAVLKWCNNTTTNRRSLKDGGMTRNRAEEAVCAYDYASRATRGVKVRTNFVYPTSLTPCSLSSMGSYGSLIATAGGNFVTGILG
ncbi:ethylene-responsive transcription factor ESR2-like [Abeliophyllum distichum]|uniref:Ethylene-responsive transcription factor ESR2-like n=1 Tax=Abeliophyllum distichum TaxID=126358 RepID=A0ABD1VVZ6_9LAMI